MSFHVCIVTSAHPLDDVRVYSKFAESFLAAGHRVSWVGPRHSYFKDEADLDPRIEYHLLPPVRSRRARLRSGARVVRLAMQLTDVDWYYVPDPDAARALSKAARRVNGRVLFDVHEVFHGALLDRWAPRAVRPVARRAVRRAISATCARTDLVAGVSESVLEPYLDPARGIVVRNSAPAWFAEQAVPNDRAPGVVTFVHGKTLQANGTPVITQALRGIAPDLAMRVLMFPRARTAPYDPGFEASLADRGVADHVWLHDAVTLDQMPALLASCDVGMIAYGRDLGRDSLPNRLFEYMAVGLAILAPSYATEIRRIVEAEGIGRVVDFEDPDAVAREMEWFTHHRDEAAEMGRRAKAAFVQRYSWEREFERLDAALETISHSGGPA